MWRDADNDNPLTEDEWPDGDGGDGDDSIEVEPCPECGKLIAEGTPQCPHCKTWVRAVTQAELRLRTWHWPLLAAGVVGMILFVWHGLRC
ncbi:MAG: hypothetical protein L6Q92_14470 [Phycisphaerae bacterium]|nr:hypothetical protein [Phycisphaerae bacterium]